MDHKDRIAICKKCINKDFDLQQGIVCKLSGLPAAFEDECPDFSENPEIGKYSRSDEDESLKEIAKLFRLFLKGRFVVTPMIIIASILLFLLMIKRSTYGLAPDEITLVKFGANIKSFTVYGEYWRMLTAYGLKK